MTTTRLLTIAVALVGCSGPATAEVVRLCTAKPSGTYAQVGADIRHAALADGLDVAPIETEGSMDNLSRLASGACDAAILQADAYLLFQRAAAGSRLELRRPAYLYDELAHLVCRDDAGVGRLRDIVEPGRRVRVASGSEASGSALTWGSFGVIDPAFGEVEHVEIGTDAALDALTGSRSVDCLFHVSAPGSPWVRDTLARRGGLGLVAITDRALIGASIAGIEVYRQALIDRAVYPGLVPAGVDGVPSLAVRAVLVVTGAWADARAASHASLMRALEAARPAIARRISGD